MAKDFLEKTLVVRDAPRFTEPVEAERQGTLTVLLGGDVGAVFPLGTSTLIGRSPEAQVPLEDDGVSRRHARIACRNDCYEIEDLGSTNGTLVDGSRISSTTRLEQGARVQIGNTVLRFALQDQLERDASKRIYEMAVRDGLTGVFNRRYFEERITSEFAFAARHGSSLCVLLVDIDHFKRVNDRWGHQAGDMVLRRVAGALRSGVRTEDVVARYGGEEFAVLARGIDVVGARMFAERVRLMVERAHIVWDDEPIAVTISVGFAHNHAGGAVSKAERLVAAADQALYAAKRAGRNRVELATSPGRYSAVNTDSVVPPAPVQIAVIPSQQHPAAQPRRRVWEQATAPNDQRHDVPGARRVHRSTTKQRLVDGMPSSAKRVKPR